MPLVLYDTLSRQPRPFEPLRAGRVGIYVCGPTVQSPPHVGHLRSAVVFDILRRWLLVSGFEVDYVRNVTDIDDKIIANAAVEGISTWALAERNHRAFLAAYDAVGVLPPTIEPRATGHVTEMVTLMQVLIDRGHAYAAGGDVYFDVSSFEPYGALSGQRPGEVQQGEVDDSHKRSPVDFALWKSAKPGEPTWPTPWGQGRPGWHLECSAMATKYLAQPFDIHGGGLDLVFPHHENELAQSVCGGGVDMARWWVHHGLVNIGGAKMSKSLGNSAVVEDVLAAGVRPAVLRYSLGSSHYRSNIDYTDSTLAEAEAAYSRIEIFVRNAVERLGGLAAADATVLSAGADGATWEQFAAAMDDDLAVPRALAVLHTAIGEGNKLLAGSGDALMLARCVGVVRRGLHVLGLDPISQWAEDSGDLMSTVGALVDVALAARIAARERKDYGEADLIRDRLTAAGIVVEDTAGGARWHLAGQ
ncbi:MAG: cysteine--tRNA ligase [Mycobacteriales bacterium]